MRIKQSGFTLIEMVVAIAIMAMVICFAGIIFKVSIGSYRIASANAEIMRKMRALTDQLNLDFKGVRKGMPIVVWPDRIVFIAIGDFQSILQYPYMPSGIKTVSGNLASIFYGMTTTSTGRPVLSRGQMILTSDPCLPPLDPNTLGEYCKLSLYELKAEAKNIFGTKFRWAGGHLPPLDIYQKEEDLARYMIDDINDFTIECAGWKNGLIWQKRNNVFVDSDHSIKMHKRHGTNALKFSFTLYDSKRIIKNGRRFTHIVYIGD